VQFPPAPPGGLNFSKLPDVMGINIGMPVQQAVAVVKSKWPVDRVKVFYAKFPKMGICFTHVATICWGFHKY
jgi:hypothetical protein